MLLLVAVKKNRTSAGEQEIPTLPDFAKICFSSVHPKEQWVTVSCHFTGCGTPDQNRQLYGLAR